MIPLGDAIDIGRRNIAILEQVQAAHPTAEILVLPSTFNGHMTLASSAVNNLVDHVDIEGSRVYPYVVVPVQATCRIKNVALQSWPNTFKMRTDEGEETDWAAEMRLAGIPDVLIERIKELAPEGVYMHRDSNIAGNLTFFF